MIVIKACARTSTCLRQHTFGHMLFKKVDEGQPESWERVAAEIALFKTDSYTCARSGAQRQEYAEPCELQAVPKRQARPRSRSPEQRPEVVVRETVDESTGTTRRATFNIQEMDDSYKVIKSTTVSSRGSRVIGVRNEKFKKPRRELGQSTPFPRSLQPPPRGAIGLDDTDDAVAIELDDTDDAPVATDPLGTPWADARRMNAHRIVPDGNCQFRAVALAAAGKQSFHAEFCQAVVGEVTGAIPTCTCSELYIITLMCVYIYIYT